MEKNPIFQESNRGQRANIFEQDSLEIPLKLPHKNPLTSRVLNLRDQGHHSYFIKISEENERIFPPIARRNPPRLRSPTTENWIEISSWRGLPVPRKKGWVAMVTSPVFCPLHPSATLHPFDIAFPELSWKPLPSSTLSLSLFYYISPPHPFLLRGFSITLARLVPWTTLRLVERGERRLKERLKEGKDK